MEAILSVKRSVTIGTMKKFDGDGEGDGKFKFESKQKVLLYCNKLGPADVKGTYFGCGCPSSVAPSPRVSPRPR